MTLTKAEIVEHLQTNTKASNKQLKQLVKLLFSTIREILVDGESLKLSGFGNFYVRDKKARMGRNPKTGEEALINARRVVVFRAGDKLRKNIESGAGLGKKEWS